MVHVQILETYPCQSQVEIRALLACIEACYDCTQSCIAWANIYFDEQDIKLNRCLRLNLDCAEVCHVTGQLLSCETNRDWGILCNQLQKCLLACQICEAECKQYAHYHKYCRKSAEACRRCQEACHELLARLNQAATKTGLKHT